MQYQPTPNQVSVHNLVQSEAGLHSDEEVRIISGPVDDYSLHGRGLQYVKCKERALHMCIAHSESHLRPYRDEPSASRPIRADKHRRGQRVLTWVTSREHCAAAGFFLLPVAGIDILEWEEAGLIF